MAALGADVGAFALGDTVYGATNDQFVGGYAEYALVEAGKIAPKPAALDYVTAAGLPVVAVTAWQMLFEYARIEPGQAILVRGALRPDVLAQHWGQIGQALEVELSETGLSLNEFLKARDSRWRLVGRVNFNLAENRRDLECPFAFMATYTSGLAASGALRLGSSAGKDRAVSHPRRRRTALRGAGHWGSDPPP